VPVPFSDPGVKTPSPSQPSSLPPGSTAGLHSAAGSSPAGANRAFEPAANAANAPTAQNGPQFAQPAARPAGGRWPVWLLAAAAAVIVAGLGAVVVLLFLVRALSPPTIVVNVPQPTASAAAPVGSPNPGNTARAAPDAGSGPAAADDEKPAAGARGNSAAPSGEPAPPKDPNAALRAKLDGTLFLIEVEKQVGASSNFWPFATCVAVGDNVLLTTAREAAQLANWRQQQHFKIWVTRQSAGFKEEVEDIRVAGEYSALPETTNDWIYVNLGLLTVRKKLPNFAPLASPEELAKLKGGSSLFCFGFSHNGEMITEEDTFEPRLARLRVFLITRADLPGQPRLLHVRADLPQNLYGSPVINAEGKVVGLYAEAAGLPGGAAAADAAELKDMHYITLINPAAIDQGLRDPGSKAWVPPAVQPAPKTHDR
jgi:hypothetical protein